MAPTLAQPNRAKANRRFTLAVAPLAALLIAGAALRIWLMSAYRPAFLGYADSEAYVLAAKGQLFSSPLRPAGYPLVLRIIHEVSANLQVTIFLQHLLGLATAVLLYLGIRHLGASRWLALLPAAVVLLDGGQLFMEHAVMSDTTFTFLVVAGLYAGVRALDSPLRRWPLAMGACIGAATTLRTIGVPLIAAAGLWLLLVPGDRRTRLVRAVAGGGCALAIALGYLLAQWAYTDSLNLNRSNGWSTYARAATFADCSRFKPPPGTRVLCERTPPSKRSGGVFYEFFPDSPAVRAFGPVPHENAKVGAFARAAIVHQPLDYLQAAGEDFIRYLAPNAFPRYLSGGDINGLIPYLTDPTNTRTVLPLVGSYYGTKRVARRGLGPLADYAHAVRLDGTPTAVLLVLALLAPLLARGRARLGALLFLAVGILLMLVPVVTVHYDARYAISAYGPLAAAAAVTLGALGTRMQRARAAQARS